MKPSVNVILTEAHEREEHILLHEGDEKEHLRCLVDIRTDLGRRAHGVRTRPNLPERTLEELEVKRAAAEAFVLVERIFWRRHAN